MFFIKTMKPFPVVYFNGWQIWTEIEGARVRLPELPWVVSNISFIQNLANRLHENRPIMISKTALTVSVCGTWVLNFNR